MDELDDLNLTHENILLNPRDIYVEPTTISLMVYMQKMCSKAIWRPSPGRNLSFLVKHKDKVIGLIHLTSPVINLGVRDNYLKLDKDPKVKGEQLRDYYDMSVCVGIQPLAWYWNIGKLTALLAPTLGDFINERYPNDRFRGVTTTSLWGKSIQYDRVFKMFGF